MQANKPLSELSTFGIGGPAKWFAKAETIEEMQALICQKLPFIVIGKGSNVLFDDRGFNGLVILNKINFFENPAPGLYHVGGGFSFALLGVRTAQAGFTGLEFASGIPASVGGAVFMNAGANGMETQKSLVSVDFVTEEGELVTLDRKDLHFDYRTSSFHQRKGAIVGASFQLTPSLAARQKQIEIVTSRKNTQPYNDKSAGCVFRNPEGGIAGRLIEEAGLKGKMCGEAKVSEKHANFIVNTNKARAQDILRLLDEVQKAVFEKHGVLLEKEVRIIPYE